MKFSMEIPIGVVTPGEFQTAAAVAEMASALEAAGIDGCFVTDHPAPSARWLHTAGMGHDTLDPFAALSFIAAVSSRLMLQTNIVVLPYRNPFLTAKGAATVQALSGGRLILGVAPGYQKEEFEALGVDFHKRGALTDEALDVIRMAWAGGPVTVQGRGFNAPGNEPRPAPDPAPPIWVGGASDKAVQRAARAGDGWCPFFSDPRQSQVNQDAAVQSIEHLRERIAEIQAMRAEQGRTGQFDISIGPRERLRFGQPGGADAYLEALKLNEAAGVTWTTVGAPHPSRQAFIENVQWFGEEVIAKL